MHTRCARKGFDSFVVYINTRFFSITSKNRLYGPQVAANDEEFVVAGATTFGALTDPFRQLLHRAVSNTDSDAGDPILEVARAIVFATGLVITSAERQLGVIHTTLSLDGQITKQSTGRPPSDVRHPRPLQGGSARGPRLE